MGVTGIHCTIDKLGRIVVPAQVRRMLRIEPGQRLAFSLDELERSIIMLPLSSSCLFCGREDSPIQHLGKEVCEPCATRLRDLYGDG